jgi:hypothetical protein
MKRGAVPVRAYRSVDSALIRSKFDSERSLQAGKIVGDSQPSER